MTSPSRCHLGTRRERGRTMIEFKCEACGKRYESPLKVIAVSHACKAVEAGKSKVRAMVPA